MIEMLTYPQILVTIGLVLSSVLFVANYKRENGLGRIVLLTFLGGTMLYYVYRFVFQILYYELGIFDARQTNEYSKHAQLFLIAPLVIIAIIEISIELQNRRKRRRKL